MVWYGMVWYGMVWYGMVWYGMVWYLVLLQICPHLDEEQAGDDGGDQPQVARAQGGGGHQVLHSEFIMLPVST